MNHPEKTLADLARNITENPVDAWAIAHRGQIYSQTQRYEEALTDFHQAIELKPDYIWAIAHRGEIYRLTRCWREALADFDRAITLNRNYIWAIAHRGATYSQMKRSEEALADLNQTIEQKPDYAWALIYRAETYVPRKQYREALADVDQAIELDPTILPHWRGERGLILNYLGRYAETIACCEQALQEDAQDYIARYSLVIGQVCGQGLTEETQAEISDTRAFLKSLLERAIVTETRAALLYRLGGLAALQGEANQALNCLEEAISLDDEPQEQARHDPAWRDLHHHPHFQSLINESIIET